LAAGIGKHSLCNAIRGGSFTEQRPHLLVPPGAVSPAVPLLCLCSFWQVHCTTGQASAMPCHAKHSHSWLCKAHKGTGGHCLVLRSGFSTKLCCRCRVVNACPCLPLLLGAVSPAVPLLVPDTHPQLAATHSYNHSSCKAVPSPAIAARRNASSRPFAMYLQLLKVHCTSQRWMFKAPPSLAIAARRGVSSGAVASH
jgi:hypothetical protein